MQEPSLLNIEVHYVRQPAVFLLPERIFDVWVQEVMKP